MMSNVATASRHHRIRIASSRTALSCAAIFIGALLASCGGTPSSGASHARSTVQEEALTRVGDLVIRANALPTASLNAAVAKQYGIEAKPGSVMLLVSIRKGSDDRETSVQAKVSATAGNLLGDKQPIALREIRSGEFIDYVGNAEVIMPDTLRFDIDASTFQGQQLSLQFNRDFFQQ